MRLSDLQSGESGVIVRVNGHGSFRKRLIEMGFIRGKLVRCVLGAPLRDPIEYEVLGYKVSLRRSEAQNIDIVSEAEAEEALHTDEHLIALEPTNRADKVDQKLLDRALAHVAEERRHVIRVALVGNPNCGKTSLFNIAAGAHEHVGNYSGVTVDAKEGHFEHNGYKITLVDLPGTYSLSAYSPEELYVRRNLIDAMPDVIVNVVDASNIERNLYLTTQLIDMNLRTVVALNMYDELRAKGDKLDIQQLSYLFGMPVCPTVSRSGEGVSELFDTVIKIYEQSDPSLSRHIHVNHGAELEKSIDRLTFLIREYPAIRSRYSTRYLAIKYLENDSDIEALIEREFPNAEALRRAREEESQRIRELLGSRPESAIVDAKYAFIQGALTETYQSTRRRRRTLTDRIDAVVTSRWAAFPIFLGLLFFIFWATFALGDYPVQWIEAGVEWLGAFVAGLLPVGWVRDLLVDGVIGGVGAVLVFLPNILILYFFISLMEDSGYMSRAAFIVDKLMHRIGLHGKSFIPMVMGFGCNVPAIMATRAIENRKSRLITLSVIPFMSCAGRVPIFVMLSGAFFPSSPALATMGIYLLGIVLALLSSYVMSKFVRDDDLPFVMELPPYRMPTGKAIWRHTWEKGRQYLQKMATTILVCSVVIWALMYFPVAPDASPREQQEQSLIGHIGQAIEPALEPLGFDWRMDVGLLAGIGAKEMLVGTMGVLYGVEDAAGADESDLAASTTLQRALASTTSRAAGLAFMVFVLLYFPCVATFVAIKSETGRWRWAIGVAIYTILIAYLCAFIAYRIGLAVL